MTWIVLGVLAAELATQAPSPPAPVHVDALQWLAGCWIQSSGQSVIEEHWTRPSGETMLGMGRTVRNGKTTEFEFVQIREESGRLVYDARPSGQTPASFPLLRLTSSEVVFENLAHDFPQRVIYRRNADGSVTARIEGEQKGRVRGRDFPYQRCH
jgi:hypothetical protein